MNRETMSLNDVMVGQKWTRHRDSDDYWIRSQKSNDRGEPICCNLDTGEIRPFNQLMRVSCVVSSGFVPKPPWLPALRDKLLSQDNRCTSHPLFLVQEVERVYGNDHHGEARPYEWYDPDDCEGHWDTDAELCAELKIDVGELPAHEDEFECDGRTYEKVHYVNRWKFVTAHLTNDAAKRYIEENAHNLKEPRTYVTSQYRCHEWILVNDWLAGKPENER